MTQFHPLLHAVLDNVVSADSSSFSRSENIANQLGIGVRPEPSTLPYIIVKRIHDGDWVFSLSLDFLDEGRANALKQAVKTFIKDPRTALQCKYETDQKGHQIVQLPIEAWIGDDAPSHIKAFLETGVKVSLILTRPDENELWLTRIDVDAREIHSTYQRTQNRTE